ncbi:MAG: hypothetical protein ACNA7Y_01640 [Gammaproteobacteria bacterium]
MKFESEGKKTRYNIKFQSYDKPLTANEMEKISLPSGDIQLAQERDTKEWYMVVAPKGRQQAPVVLKINDLTGNQAELEKIPYLEHVDLANLSGFLKAYTDEEISKSSKLKEEVVQRVQKPIPQDEAHAKIKQTVVSTLVGAIDLVTLMALRQTQFNRVESQPLLKNVVLLLRANALKKLDSFTLEERNALNQDASVQSLWEKWEKTSDSSIKGEITNDIELRIQSYQVAFKQQQFSDQLKALGFDKKHKVSKNYLTKAINIPAGWNVLKQVESLSGDSAKNITKNTLGLLRDPIFRKLVKNNDSEGLKIYAKQITAEKLILLRIKGWVMSKLSKFLKPLNTAPIAPEAKAQIVEAIKQVKTSETPSKLKDALTNLPKVVDAVKATESPKKIQEITAVIGGKPVSLDQISIVSEAGIKKIAPTKQPSLQDKGAKKGASTKHQQPQKSKNLNTALVEDKKTDKCSQILCSIETFLKKGERSTADLGLQMFKQQIVKEGSALTSISWHGKNMLIEDIVKELDAQLKRKPLPPLPLNKPGKILSQERPSKPLPKIPGQT